jgi:predicted DNA-binding transcriptional regulator YafY
MLQDMGIPIEAERGRYGGYRLRAGFKLPPLMWTEEEALAITLGLQAAQHLGISKTVPTLESALAKVERVLPPPLRERVQAVQETVVLDLDRHARTEQSKHIMFLSTAAHQRKTVWIRYQTRLGEESAREFDCYGLAYHHGYWYAAGYCHLRQTVRLFRLDRIHALEVRAEDFTPPDHFDCLAYTIQAIAAIPSRWLIKVLLQAHIEEIRSIVPAEFVTLEELPGGILLCAYDEDLPHTARFLVNLGRPFRILQPPELTEELRALAKNILEMLDPAEKATSD